MNAQNYQAAEHEAIEEAGVEVTVVRVLRLMLGDGHTPRVIFLARPTKNDAVCKLVPDFESVGAMWVSHQALGELRNPEDYRSPDPVEYFPAVAYGRVEGHSVETSSLQSFEAVVRELTLKSRLSDGDLDDFKRAWRQLKLEYPEDAFIE